MVPITSSTSFSTTKTSKITCRDPKIPLNMVQSENHVSYYSPGSSVDFSCVEGYKMLGNNMIHCTKSGRWTRLQGKCRSKYLLYNIQSASFFEAKFILFHYFIPGISCREPEVSKRTKIIGESYLYEDVVTILCGNNAKYELKCSKEGIWEGPRNDLC